MKLAIVGSVSLEGNVKAYEIIDEVIAIYAPDEIISGGARGIDSMAAERAWEHNIPMTVFLPKDRSWKHGFKPRNLQIAQACDVLVRIVAKGSKTYGSGWTRDRAKEMGKPTEEFVI